VLATCPCGSIEVRRIKGDELTIRSIEIEDEEVE
jgi:Zn finger protein HypA/HybF involved in hydrogenase expression